MSRLLVDLVVSDRPKALALVARELPGMDPKISLLKVAYGGAANTPFLEDLSKTAHSLAKSVSQASPDMLQVAGTRRGSSLT